MKYDDNACHSVFALVFIFWRIMISYSVHRYPRTFSNTFFIGIDFILFFFFSISYLSVLRMGYAFPVSHYCRMNINFFLFSQMKPNFGISYHSRIRFHSLLRQYCNNCTTPFSHRLICLNIPNSDARNTSQLSNV